MNIIDRIKKKNIDKKLRDIEFVKSLKPKDLEQKVFANITLIEYIYEKHLEYKEISEIITKIEFGVNDDTKNLNEYINKRSQMFDVYQILFENAEIMLFLLKKGYLNIKDEAVIDFANNNISFALKVVAIKNLFPEKFGIYFEKFSHVMNFETFLSFFDEIKNKAENYDEILNYMVPISLSVLEEYHFMKYISLFKKVPQLAKYSSNKDFFEKYDNYILANKMRMFDCHDDLLQCAFKLNVDILTIMNDVIENKFIDANYVDVILKEMCMLNDKFVKECIDLIAKKLGCDYSTWNENEDLSKNILNLSLLKNLDNPEFSQKFQEIFSVGIQTKFLNDKKFVDEHFSEYNQRWINYDEDALVSTFGSPTYVNHDNMRVRFYTANGQEFKMLVHSIVNSDIVKSNGSDMETQKKIGYLQKKLGNNPALFVDSGLGLKNTSISCSTICERDICTFGAELVNPKKDQILIGFNESNKENMYHYHSGDAGLNRDAHLSSDSTIYKLCTPKVKKTDNLSSYDEVDISRVNRKPQYILTPFPPQDIINNEIVMKWASYYNIPIIYVDRKAYINKYRKELRDLLNSRDNTKCLSGDEKTLYNNILFCMKSYGIDSNELEKYNFMNLQISIFEKYPTYNNALAIVNDRDRDINYYIIASIGGDKEEIYKKIVLAYLEVTEDYDIVWCDFKESLSVPRIQGDKRNVLDFYKDWKKKKEGNKKI